MPENAFAMLNRRTVRAPVNPLDKATIVSVYPKAITEVKYTIQPGVFNVPAGTPREPSLLVVGPSSWWKELDDSQPPLEIPISSIVIADSVVRDYCNGLYMCNMGDCMPGLFFIPGEQNTFTLKQQYQHLVDAAIQKQRNWFFALVQAADTLWSRTNGNPLAISDDARIGARELGLEKDWLANFQHVELVKCLACGSLRNPLYPVCPTCKAIVDTDKAKDFKFADR